MGKIVRYSRKLRFVTFGLLVCFVAALGCPGTSPMAVVGPQVDANVVPTLTIEDPTKDFSVSKGERFIVRWRDSDSDSNALISIEMVSKVDETVSVLVLQDRPENDEEAPDYFTVDTTLIAEGEYYLKMTINDAVNSPVEVFALTEPPDIRKVEITIAPPGAAPQDSPPIVTVTQPSVNLGVSQDDRIDIIIQPLPYAQEPPATIEDPIPEPYDRDSDTTVYIVFDLDSDPTNDDPVSDVSGIDDGIIVVEEQPIEEDFYSPITFTQKIDVAEIPIRADGLPYFIRATITDGVNPPSHSYADGTVNVLELVEGEVDLGEIGRTLAGARFLGFNPGANLGSRMLGGFDFDADGVEDFVMVAQFGNPRNFGNIGEAYLVYGERNRRFGGDINVNSISTTVSGVIFEAPPARIPPYLTNGITDFAVIDPGPGEDDLSGDGRPELLFGLSHIDGIFSSRDDDPSDDPPQGTETIPVELIIREGEVRIIVNEIEEIPAPYSGVADTYIDSEQPNDNHGNDGNIRWFDGGANDRKWTLIRFDSAALRAVIPDDLGEIENATATLEFRIITSNGPDAAVHQLITLWDEDTVTYSSFAVAGGEPEADDGNDDNGQEDYRAEELGTISGSTADPSQAQTVDVTESFLEFITGLGGSEPMSWILLPGSDTPTSDTIAESSNFTAVEDFRPTLRLEYERGEGIEALGCYPDPFANNLGTDEPRNDWVGGGAPDVSTISPYAGWPFESLGTVILVNSENRDAHFTEPLNPDRLEGAVVTLELVGQEDEAFDEIDDIGVMAIPGREVTDPDQERTTGCRFQAGLYDSVDHLAFGQPGYNGLWGQTVSMLSDLDNDHAPEIMISAPRNVRDDLDFLANFGPSATHHWSRTFRGDVVVFLGTDFSQDASRENDGAEGNATWPHIRTDTEPPPTCSVQDPIGRTIWVPRRMFEIFGESSDDMLGGARNAEDFNLDGSPDMLMGAPLNNAQGLQDAGTMYVVYGRVPFGDYMLALANNPTTRPPMLRVFGESTNDQIGYRQELGFDVNGDRISDVFISSPYFDGRDATDMMVADNGFVGIVFGGQQIDGDRTVSQIATTELLGVRFYGANQGDLAGWDISTAGDFNQDGFGDLLIAAPGEQRFDEAGIVRQGVVYLIFGGVHLAGNTYTLNQVGTQALPGIVFLSPYQRGSADEAAPDHVGFIGDVNDDGFDDIMIGNTPADFVDPAEPGSRRPNAGEAYLIYGNNFGDNRIIDAY